MTTLVCNFSDVLGTPVPNGIARVTSGEVRPGLLADTVIVPRIREQPLVGGSAVFPQVEPGDIVIHLIWGDQHASIRTLVPDQETVSLSDCIQYDQAIPTDIETARALAIAARESQNKARQYAEEAASAVTQVTGIVSDASAAAVVAVQAELDEELARAEAAVAKAEEHEAGAAAAAAAEVNKIKGEAPEAFDTLGEIAAELATNETERAALASLIGSKADREHRHTWDQVDDKPAVFPPEGHSHPEYATTDQVNARTPEIREVSALPASPVAGVVYLVTG